VRINQTIEVALELGIASLPPVIPEFSIEHLLDMQVRANTNAHDMSDEKLNRWLGWIQAAVVASGVMSLEDVKTINR